MLKLFRWFRKRKKQQSKEYLNVVEGMGKAKDLYKSLIAITHPDKHPNEEKIYTEIMDRITANRYNYSELVKIKQEVERLAL